MLFYDVYMTSSLIAKRKAVLHDKIANISIQVISSHQHNIPFKIKYKKIQKEQKKYEKAQKKLHKWGINC